MSDPHQAGTLSAEDSQTALTDLWGTPGDTRPERQAQAWARRTLSLPAEPGDAELLAEVRV